MTYILLSILSSTTVLIIFKLLQRFNAKSRQTIMVSYAMSVLAGILIFSPKLNSFISPWLGVSAIEGIAFYISFRWMAITTEINGISVTSIASKMSVVIPILIGITVLNEQVNLLIIAGILCGLLAVYLSATASGTLELKSFKWPLILFVGSGLIDATFKGFQVLGLTQSQFPTFMITVFAFAFLSGLIHHFFNKDRSVTRASLIAGGFLGLANMGTVYFILLALAVPSVASIFVYSINSFGIVFASTLVAVVLFREKLALKGWLGLLLAVAAIVLLYLGNI